MSDAIIANNLAAMGRWTPGLAKILEAVPVPPGWEYRRGTDATWTFAHSSSDGKTVEWLGGTSHPQTSAAPLIASLVVGDGNALGLSLGSGFEWKELLTRLHSHQMLYVLETDLALARMVLSVCDLSGYLESGKLVLLLPEEGDPMGSGQRQLVDFLAKNTGFDPPAVMHPLPTLPGPRRHELLALGEAISRQAAMAQSQRTARVAAAIAEMKPQPDRGRVLVIQAMEESLLGKMYPASGNVIHVRVDRHDEAAALRRMEALLAHQPGVVVSDLFRPQMAMPLPMELGVRTLVPALPGAAYWQPERLPEAGGVGEHDRVIVHAWAHRQLLEDHGIAGDKIVVVPLGVDEGDGGRWTQGERVVMVGDVPTVEPEGYGFTLPSHVAIWNAAAEILGESGFDTLHPDMVPDVVRRAQRRTGIELGDPVLEKSLQRGVRHILFHGVPVLRLAKYLADNGIPLSVVGDGWQQEPLKSVWSKVHHVRSVEALADAAIMLHASVDGAIHPLTLHAAMAGIAVVGITHPWQERAGALPSILRPGIQAAYAPMLQLLQTLRHLLKDQPKRIAMGRSASENIRIEHTWISRGEYPGII